MQKAPGLCKFIPLTRFHRYTESFSGSGSPEKVRKTVILEFVLFFFFLDNVTWTRSVDGGIERTTKIYAG
mgnify:CR=1 FL=1